MIVLARCFSPSFCVLFWQILRGWRGGFPLLGRAYQRLVRHLRLRGRVGQLVRRGRVLSAPTPAEGGKSFFRSWLVGWLVNLFGWLI